MKRFNAIYKEKQTIHEQASETQVLADFTKVYNALLEHYTLTSLHDLDEKSQVAFMTELNQYWTEEKGISQLGESFVAKRSMRLNENSTTLQRKNYFKSKAVTLINEILRQSDTKYKLYDIIDEMYNQTKSKDVSDILSPDMIVDLLGESFIESVDNFRANIYTELSESAKKDKKPKAVNESVKKVYIKKKKV